MVLHLILPKSKRAAQRRFEPSQLECPAVDSPPCSLSDDLPQGHPCANLVYFSSEAETGSAVYNHLGAHCLLHSLEIEALEIDDRRLGEVLL